MADSPDLNDSEDIDVTINSSSFRASLSRHSFIHKYNLNNIYTSQILNPQKYLPENETIQPIHSFVENDHPTYSDNHQDEYEFDNVPLCASEADIEI